MATKKETNTQPDVTAETPVVEDAVKQMTVWRRLSNARLEVLTIGTKKSGINAHASYDYFKLEDIVPIANPVLAKWGLMLQLTFEETFARAYVRDLYGEQPPIIFQVPFAIIMEPAKFRMNEVQAMGSSVTYFRRYMYFLVLDLIEIDPVDSGIVPNMPKPEPVAETPVAPMTQSSPIPLSQPIAIEQSKTPPTNPVREQIAESITNEDAPIDDIQRAALERVLGHLLKIDPSNETWIQEMGMKTNGFRDITKKQCDDLIMQVNDFVKANGGGQL